MATKVRLKLFERIREGQFQALDRSAKAELRHGAERGLAAPSSMIRVASARGRGGIRMRSALVVILSTFGCAAQKPAQTELA